MTTDEMNWTSKEMPSTPEADGGTHFVTDLFEYMSHYNIRSLAQLFQSFELSELSEAATLELAFLSCFLEGDMHVQNMGDVTTPVYWISGTNQNVHYSCKVNSTVGQCTVVCGENPTPKVYTGIVERYGKLRAFVSNYECIAIWPER